MAVARAWVRAAVLLVVASLHGCGDWTPQTYCDEKVKVECKNFDDILEMKQKEDGAKPEDFTPSHPMFYQKCQTEEGKKALVSSCAQHGNWKKFKHSGEDGEDNNACTGTVSLAMNAPHHVVRGRRVLDCMEAELKDQNAKPWVYTPSEEDEQAAEKPKAKGKGEAGAEMYCDCTSKDENTCGEGKENGKVEDGVSDEEVDTWCKENMEDGKSLGRSSFLCMCHQQVEDCKHPPMGVSYAAAEAFCKELGGVEEFEADLFEGLGKCEGDGELQLKATYRERQNLFEKKKALSEEATDQEEAKAEAQKVAKELCEKAGRQFTEESALELPPRPRRPKTQGVLAQDTSRTEKDHDGVKVRLAASRQMEVLADGQSRRALS